MCRMEAKVEELTNSVKCANPEFTSDGTGRPAPIDRKIIERPSKYKGDIKVFIQWHERLKTYLASQDKRWSKLLDSIESRGPNPLKCTSDFMDISEAADVQDHHEDFTKQLYLYLDTFTDGPANIAVTTAGVTMAYESYRRIAEKGRSRRPEHVLRLHTEVLQPAHVANIKDLEAAITMWEHNVEYFHRVNPQKIKITDEEMRLILTAMAPNELQEHLLK